MSPSGPPSSNRLDDAVTGRSRQQAALSFERLCYVGGVGPLGRIFAGSHYAISRFEARGLAFMIGVLLIAFRLSVLPSAGYLPHVDLVADKDCRIPAGPADRVGQ
jgi:hypothetical protein